MHEPRAGAAKGDISMLPERGAKAGVKVEANEKYMPPSAALQEVSFPSPKSGFVSGCHTNERPRIKEVNRVPCKKNRSRVQAEVGTGSARPFFGVQQRVYIIIAV